MPNSDKPNNLTVLITGNDNKTYEPAYYWAALLFIVGTICTIVGWAISHPFPITEFGAFGMLCLGGMGLARKLDPEK